MPFTDLQCEVEILLLLLLPAPPPPAPTQHQPTSGGCNPLEGVHPSLAFWPENSLRAKEPVFTLLGSVLASASHTVDAQKMFVTK